MAKDNRFILTPYYLDQPSSGLESLAASGWEINKLNLDDPQQQLRMAMLYQPLAEWVARHLAAGDRPVSIAGDCCSTIGVAAGLQRAGVEFALIWLDAHGDFNTWETTPSGFLGGMPLAMLVGRGDQTMPAAVGLQNLAEERIVISDARDLDPEEELALLGSRIIRRSSVSELIQHSLPDRPLYVHLDVDILDPREAPAMNYLASGGPSSAELHEVFRHLAETGKVTAVSMSAWNPELDGDGRTSEACMQLLETLISDPS